jgi:hypothetical protein
MSARAIREVSAHFARVRPENDGEEPWTEEDLFDLDSALAFGGSIEEIAIFLRREVEEVQRKASERNLPDVADPGPIAPTRLVDLVEVIGPDREKRPAAPSGGVSGRAGANGSKERSRSQPLPSDAAAPDEVAAPCANQRRKPAPQTRPNCPVGVSKRFPVSGKIRFLRGADRMFLIRGDEP